MHFHSRALGAERTALVYLPPGYAADVRRGQRLPVLYLLHGAPGHPKHFLTAGAVGVTEDVLLAHHRIHPLLLVMPDGSAPIHHNDSEWANTARAGRYEDLVLDTVHAVDARFPTLARRRDRGLAGLSEGGYGAMNVGLHHLSSFGVIESWSGYFGDRPRGVFRGAPPSVLAANSPLSYVGSLGPALRRWPLRAYVYYGRKDSPLETSVFVEELRAEGARVLLRGFHGGHNWALWRRHMPGALRFADVAFHGSHPRARSLARPGHRRFGAVR